MTVQVLASALIKLAAISSVPVASVSLYRPATAAQASLVERPSIIEVEDPGSQYPVSTGGYYYATASADGREIRMLIDSGANITVLSVRDAHNLGLIPSREAFREKLVTAYGTVLIALIRVDRLTIAHKTFNNPRVAVTIDDGTPSLCGSDLLSQFKSVAIADGVLQFSG